MLSHVCPVCTTRMDLDAIIRSSVEDAEARRLIEYLVLQHQPTVGASVIRYLRLFTPAKNRLSWRRAHTILREIVDALKAHKIGRSGREWHITADDFEAALASVFEAVQNDPSKLPLPSNAYLWEVLRRRADSAEAKAESEGIAQLKSGPRQVSSGLQSITDIASQSIAPGQVTGPAPAMQAAQTPSTAPTQGRAAQQMREALQRNAQRRERLLKNSGQPGQEPSDV